MSESNVPTPASQRVKGKTEEIGGAIKKNVGRIIDNEQMEVEGAIKELKGKARQEAAKADARVRGETEELTGTLKNRVGHLIDNEQMQAEGKLKELTGKARQKANQP